MAHAPPALGPPLPSSEAAEELLERELAEWGERLQAQALHAHLLAEETALALLPPQAPELAQLDSEAMFAAVAGPDPGPGPGQQHALPPLPGEGRQACDAASALYSEPAERPSLVVAAKEDSSYFDLAKWKMCEMSPLARQLLCRLWCYEPDVFSGPPPPTFLLGVVTVPTREIFAGY